MVDSRYLDSAVEAYEGNSGAQLDASEGIVLKLLTNIINNPSDEKKRSVRLENPKIHSAVIAPRGARDIMHSAGFVEQDGNLVLPAGAPLEAVQAARDAVHGAAARRATRQSAQVDSARQEYLQEVKRKKAEQDRRRAEAKAKIVGQRGEEKEMQASVSQHKGFKAGERKSATELGAGGDAKGG